MKIRSLHRELHREFKASPGNMRPCNKKNNGSTNKDVTYFKKIRKISSDLERLHDLRKFAGYKINK